MISALFRFRALRSTFENMVDECERHPFAMFNVGLTEICNTYLMQQAATSVKIFVCVKADLSTTEKSTYVKMPENAQ